MKIDDKYVSRLEKLAKLRLDEQERGDIKKDLNNILNMIETLQEVNTDGVEPLVYINENQALRADVAIKEIDQSEALKNATEKETPYFKVPKVLHV